MTDTDTLAAAIPDELKAIDQWVLWRQEQRGDKPTKVPYQVARPTRQAKSNDPSTWGGFEQALADREAGHADGIGYVFAPDDPYTGIDLDGCVRDGKLVPAVAADVAELDSYAELSPSETGAHVIVRGRLNGGRKSNRKTPWGDEFATYDRGRFFVMTGRRLPGAPADIRDRQAQLDAVRARHFGPDPPAPSPAEPSPAEPSRAPGALDPEQLAAFIADPDVAQAWTRKGPPPDDDSPSGWTLRLANLAVRAGWTDPQITALLHRYRDKHGDQAKSDRWYEHTIETARKPRPDTPPAPRPVYDPQTGDLLGGPLDQLTNTLRIEFLAIEIAGDDFYFRLRSRRTGEPELLGPIRAEVVLEPRKMRGHFWRAVGGEPLPKYTDVEWARICALFDRAAEHRDAANDADQKWHDRLIAWFDSRDSNVRYKLTEKGGLSPDDKKELLSGAGSYGSGKEADLFATNDGSLWIRQDEFERWLRRGRGITLRADDEVNKALTHLRFESVDVQARVANKPRHRAYWRSPPLFVAPEGDDA